MVLSKVVKSCRGFRAKGLLGLSGLGDLGFRGF